MATFKSLSIGNKSLRRRLMIAFGLMTIIPMLACVYLFSPYLAPGSPAIAEFSTIILTVISISILGLLVAKSIVNSVIELAGEARKISDGDYNRRIDLTGNDEIDSLSQSINAMTKRIRSSLEELKKYSQSMKEINAEIQKKVAALSSLLQIDDIISAGSIQIDSLLEFSVGKASSIFDTGFGALYMPRAEGSDFIAKVCFNADKEGLADIVIRREGHGILEKAIEDRRLVQACDGMAVPKNLADFKNSHNLKNFIAIPLYSDKAVFGLLLTGNRLEDFRYSDDDVELAILFAKHITIAIESDILEKKSKELAIRDDLTGLLNKRYTLILLEDEIKRSIFYQRPCAFIAFRIDNFKAFRDANGDLASEEALKRVAKTIRDNNIPIGKAARIGGNEFAILLPEKNKREARHIAEEMRKKIEDSNVLKDGKPAFVVSVGVSENPIDGITGDELFAKAISSIDQAKPVHS